jgi:hypothetical protein
MPGGIDCGQDYEEKEPVTDDANNNALPSFVHSSSSPRPFESRTRTMRLGYVPFGRRPFFSI